MIRLRVSPLMWDELYVQEYENHLGDPDQTPQRAEWGAAVRDAARTKSSAVIVVPDHLITYVRTQILYLLDLHGEWGREGWPYMRAERRLLGELNAALRSAGHPRRRSTVTHATALRRARRSR